MRLSASIKIANIVSRAYEFKGDVCLSLNAWKCVPCSAPDLWVTKTGYLDPRFSLSSLGGSGEIIKGWERQLCFSLFLSFHFSKHSIQFKVRFSYSHMTCPVLHFLFLHPQCTLTLCNWLTPFFYTQTCRSYLLSIVFQAWFLLTMQTN